MDGIQRQRYEGPESPCMESTAQHEKGVDSTLKAELKRILFVATVESVLLYGSDLNNYHPEGKIFECLLHSYAENGSKCQLAKTYEK